MDNKCYICEKPAQVWKIFKYSDSSCVKCSQCGDYAIEQMNAYLSSLPYQEEQDPLFRKRIARYLYQTRDRGDRILTRYPAKDNAGPKLFLDIDSAANLYKDDGSPLEKYQNAIIQLARQEKPFGYEFGIEEDRWLIPTLDDAEAESIVESLIKCGYLTGVDTSGFSLTPEGLQKAAELGMQTKLNGNVVFIAACFNQELEQARNTIRDVLSGLGYKPNLVNIDPHNEIIELKIYEGIRESQFIVADLTCNRQSVYYEIGFAHGLGLDVVLTCREDHFGDENDDFKRVHFDINHRNVLRWQNEDELAEKLRLHIQQSFGRADS